MSQNVCLDFFFTSDKNSQIQKKKKKPANAENRALQSYHSHDENTQPL